MDFPDLPYLKQLQSDIWQSRAAVMVGAGLSRNAEPLPSVRERFPTWRELVRTMFDELHPLRGVEKPEELHARGELFNRSSPPRIASEYEAAFERWRLDALIRAQNPDTKYRPGKLHHLLLELPWVDVFTTNYDTLLERTEVDKRAYYPVTKVAELTTAFSPRILKLHGSFPSQTPFIITEEDYRTYPRKFAAFVNTVQQCLLENSLVLIGFSGDDPNFLEWMGWIRDELGADHAPIYLVGWLQLRHAERQLLLKRGVTAIDLEPALRDCALTGDFRAAATEAFLDSLHQGRKHRPEDWPTLRPFPSLVPVCLTPVERMPEPIDLPGGLIDTDTLAKFVRRWRYEREQYPGWLIAPEETRSVTWARTERWIPPLVLAVERLPLADRIIVFREVNWRLEVVMAALLPELAGPFRQAIDEAFSELAGGRVPVGSSDFRSTREVGNTEVADGWFEIAFGLLRDAREMYDNAGWSELKGKVDVIAAAHPEYSDRAQYEAALQAMWNVDRAKAREILSTWHPSSQSPRATIWKAGLLAELDELGEARTTLRSALQEIRRALRVQGRNIELLSLEGWCSFLLPFIEFSSMACDLNARIEEFRERWAELRRWDCDPWPRWQYFEDALSTSPPRPRNALEEKHGFDFGEVHVSYHYGGGGVGPYLPAFAYIHLYEKAGIPMHLSGVNIAGDKLKRSCLWIIPVWGFWIPTLLVRACDCDALREAEILGRARVATMEAGLAQRLHTWCLQILERELASLRGPIPMGSAQADLSKLLPDVLSRLAFRMEAAELKRAFHVALRLHGHVAVRGDIRLNDCCAKWFPRLFEAAEPELLIEWLPDLIRAPLFDDSLADVPQDFWPDPMKHFPGGRIADAAREPALDAAITASVDRLIAKVMAESGAARARGVERLLHVFEAQLMSNPQKSRFGDLLWSARGTNGLPDRWRFDASCLAELPHPADVDVAAIVRAYVLALTSAGAVHDASGRIAVVFGGLREQPLIMEASFASKPLAKLLDERPGFIEWSDSEARTLYEKAREWWRADLRAFDVPRDAPADTGFPQRTAQRLGQFLARIVLPRMHSSSDQEWSDLLNWLEEIRSKGGYPTVALPYVLVYRPNETAGISAAIGHDIDCDSEDAISSAARAIRHWARLWAEGNTIPEPDSALLSALIHKVAFRRKPAIKACLTHLARLIVETPEVITPERASTIAASLKSWSEATALSVDSDCCEFHETERPDLRACVSFLAGALSVWYGKQSPHVPLPDGVVLWETTSKADPLPEVRRAFHAWDQG
jgi:hypothetical protein